MARVLIDGFNVINAVLLRGRDRRGWWREEHRQNLVDWLSTGDLACTVVFDGDCSSVESRGGVEVRYVPDADAWFVEHGALEDTVVTRDRRLVNRLHTRGVQCRSPTWLEQRLGAFPKS